MQQITNINTLEKININFEFTNENLIAYGYKPNEWLLVSEQLKDKEITIDDQDNVVEDKALTLSKCKASCIEKLRQKHIEFMEKPFTITVSRRKDSVSIQNVLEGNIIHITGDYTDYLFVSDSIVIENSTANDGIYTISEISFDNTNTIIILEETLPDTTIDGDITKNCPNTNSFTINCTEKVATNLTMANAAATIEGCIYFYNDDDSAVLTASEMKNVVKEFNKRVLPSFKIKGENKIAINSATSVEECETILNNVNFG